MVSDGNIIVGDLATVIMAVDRDLVILTTQKTNYLKDILSPMLRLRLSQGVLLQAAGTH